MDRFSILSLWLCNYRRSRRASWVTKLQRSVVKDAQIFLFCITRMVCLYNISCLRYTILVGNPWYWCICVCVCVCAETETYALAWPRRAHGRRTDLQRPPLQRTCAWKMSHRQTKDVRKRDLKTLNIDQNNWEATALKRSAWRQTVHKGLSNFEETLAIAKKSEWKERLQPMQTGQRQTSSVPSTTGTVTPASDWPATPDAVPEWTPRAQLHSLPRLKDTYNYTPTYAPAREVRKKRKSHASFP